MYAFHRQRPIGKGAWVALFPNAPERNPAIGRIVASHHDPTGDVLIDVALYAQDGRALRCVLPMQPLRRADGSHARGAAGWTPIHKPDFRAIAASWRFASLLVPPARGRGPNT